MNAQGQQSVRCLLLGGTDWERHERTFQCAKNVLYLHLEIVLRIDIDIEN